MLQRMNELAVQSANGTNSESDRTAIQNEIDQLTTEIDRVSETTKFNETYLLKGDKSLDKKYTYGYKNFATPAAGTATISTDSATKLAVTFTQDAAPASAKIQDETNELLVSLRDQGVKSSVTLEKGKQTTDAKYSLALTGDAAQKFTLTATATAGEFNVTDKENNVIGKLTVEKAGLATDADNDQSFSATNIATSITASKSGKAQAKYYDKDGNAVPENALSNYVKANTAGTAVEARTGASQLYDAVGNSN